ncbi:MAG: hypothetical protein JSS51_03975 [Planctomycetes bacterium]|nr:hypothetical protein [Planctomycetota bacterium]
MSALTAQQIMQNAGVNTLSGLTNPPARPFGYTANFDTSLAAGTAASVQVNIEQSYIFQVNELDGDVFLVNALSSAVAGSPVSRRADPASSSNTMPNLTHFRIQIKTAAGELFDQPVRLSSLLSHAEKQQFMINPIVCPPGSQVTVTLYNDSAVAVKAQFILNGMKVAVGDAK